MADGSIQVNVPQGQFLQLPNRFRAYVGGFGSGKTWIGSTDLCLASFRWPGIPQAYFAPTYGQIRDIFYPTIEEVAHGMGLKTLVRYGDAEVFLSEGDRVRSVIICRSMDRPERIVGFKIGRGLVDELDVMKREQAALAWRKIIARLRWNGEEKYSDFKSVINVTTTPEGFNFVHDQFVKQLMKNPQLSTSYGLVQASTYANAACLPEGYIESLLESYPAHLSQAYIDGKFVNLKSGSVYPMYDRKLNRTDAKIEPGEVAHVGMDFNVNNMSAIIHVIRNNRPLAVGEIIGGRDTPSMIDQLKARLWEYDGSRFNQNRTIIVYPDASGGSRHSSDASRTDLALLRAAGFQVKAHAENPPVKDRINSMNAQFQSGAGFRSYLINDELCPVYADNLEQQIWRNDEPDKESNRDHTNDAAGYFIAYKFPILTRAARVGAFEFG